MLPKLSKRATQRLFIIFIILLFCAGVAFLIMGIMHESIVYYKTPAELLAHNDDFKKIRLGGLVINGSLCSQNGSYIFQITDHKAILTVQYKGRLPDLFREGQGVVALGKFDPEKMIFFAEQILVKHDQNYKPPRI
jgi:cytochrome c-type biogenesis protein CcmE